MGVVIFSCIIVLFGTFVLVWHVCIFNESCPDWLDVMVLICDVVLVATGVVAVLELLKMLFDVL